MSIERKILVDTNVLLGSVDSLLEYKGRCVITSHVLREIEHLERVRKQDRELQFQIRKCKRFLKEHDEDMEYVIVDYSIDEDMAEIGFSHEYVDNILVSICIKNNFIMLTNDILMIKKCRLFNIETIELEKSSLFTENKGFKIVSCTKDELKMIYRNLSINHFDLIVNEYVVINDENGELLDIMKWLGEGYLVSLRDKQGNLGKGFTTQQFGQFKPIDEQQIMAVDSILNNQLTCIRGRAGSGKSLIALNTAWYLVEKFDYKLVIFCNPIASKDSAELGFYKGDRLTKLLQTIGTMLKSKFADEIEICRLIEDRKLDILPFADIRGFDTSGNKTICWFVESQNLTSELMKLGLQRIGEESKVIIDGDYHLQVDKDVYAYDNGMKRMSEVFRGKDLYGEIELQNVHRSKLADIAEEM